MARRRRLTPALLTEDAILARGAAHVLEVLKARHPDRDDVRLALRCTIELEVALTTRAAGKGPDAPRTAVDRGGAHAVLGA